MILNGDCREVLKDLIAQGVQVDSIVTDPPYELGFMGKDWDRTGIAYNVELWQLCLQILKPGGHLLAFGGARTYHRMACAIEDAGFEVRDQIMYIYGQGFPKSLNIGKAIDKAAGAEREVVGIKKRPDGTDRPNYKNWKKPSEDWSTTFKRPVDDLTAPATDAAKQWDGWGTALKPAHEPIVLARKPIAEKTIAANVLKHGTGGINIDGCRVEGQPSGLKPYIRNKGDHVYNLGRDKVGKEVTFQDRPLGRFPANLIHDGSGEVLAEFAKYGVSKSDSHIRVNSDRKDKYIYGDRRGVSLAGYDDKGSASRFYYCAKASKKERAGSKHPTIKPLSLMRYLCRLITPPGGTVLDPFAGTGTTGQAAILESFKPLLIEKEEQYIADIEKRLYG